MLQNTEIAIIDDTLDKDFFVNKFIYNVSSNLSISSIHIIFFHKCLLTNKSQLLFLLKVRYFTTNLKLNLIFSFFFCVIVT